MKIRLRCGKCKKPADPKDRNDLRCKICGAWGIERKEGREWILMI